MVDHRFSEQKNCKISKFCKKIRNETLIQYEKKGKESEELNKETTKK